MGETKSGRLSDAFQCNIDLPEFLKPNFTSFASGSKNTKMIES